MVYQVLALSFTLLTSAFGQDGSVVFKSDVALARVDAQVLDRNGHAVTGLEKGDFVLRINGRVVPIRNFASENMPIDILLLLDVSGSMQPHVQRIASAAQQALDVLAPKDRIAIMVFDTYTRVRLPFRNSHSEITGELNHVLRSEGFNGGTRITHALLDAANYVQREGRQDARRAIVILTDDETQDGEDETRVENALAQANAVLSFLQAPYEPPQMNGGRLPRGNRGGRGGWPGTGPGWPGGGGIGFPGGGPVILGPGGRGGYGGGRDESHSAGTADIANDSGGDTMHVDEASALEDTLARLRQRYTLNFYFPDASTDRGSVRVDLSQEARIRYTDAEIHSRQVFIAGNKSGERAGPTVLSRQPNEAASDSITQDRTIPDETTQPKRRRVAVNEEAEPGVEAVGVDSGGSDQQADRPPGQPAPSPEPLQRRGWPRADQQTSPKPN